MKIIAIGDTSSTNFGDPILTNCTKYIYQDVASSIEQGSQCYTFDIVGRKPKTYESRTKATLLKSPKSNISPLPNKFLRGIIKELQLIYRWYRTDKKCFLTRFEKGIGNDVDLIVIAGGALLSSSLIYALRLSAIITFASNHQLPVVFSSVGVEKSVNFLTGRIFKKMLKSPCIKAFSTRDNVDVVKTLTDNTDFHVQTPDPGIFASETYNICKNNKSKVIGIGVISYAAYLSVAKNEPRVYDLTENDLLEFWAQIIRELELRGVEWKIFTNGGSADYQEALKLVQYIGCGYEKLCCLPETPKDLVNTISSFKAILCHRLHAFIIASSLSVPAVPVIWSNKVVSFAEMTGTSYYWPSIENAKQISKCLCSEDMSRINTVKSDSLKQRMRNRVYEILNLDK